ncbi:hypothetical protein WG906_09225 [Pedobacter sp. P351]|uniref:hypothetical protein n=1 Tax=Pedobacter superstes TaxID=3133441 RepID=UPI0030A1F1EB
MVRLLFIMLFASATLNASDLPQIRKDYYSAVNDEKAADRFYQSLKSQNSSEPIVMAYFGSAQAIRARHAFNPYNKISYLKSGLKTLEAAVSKSPDNLEIRFLRFSLEHYIPAFLGYSKHLEADKRKIIELAKQKKFGAMDKPLLLNLVGFMKETKRCSPLEIATLEQVIAHG